MKRPDTRENIGTLPIFLNIGSASSATTDGKGYTHAYETDARGVTLAYTDPLGNIMQYERDSQSQENIYYKRGQRPFSYYKRGQRPFSENFFGAGSSFTI